MKILAPISRIEEVIPFIDAGADELYCGVMPHEWESRYTDLSTLNHRGGVEANFESSDDLAQAVRLAHTRKVRIFCTLNLLYSAEQYPLILDIVQELEKLDMDGLIVSDIGVLSLLKRLETKLLIHISTLANIFNHSSAKFFADLGGTRLILPRQITIAEVEAITRGEPRVEYEFIVLNDLCLFIDGLCGFYHSTGWRPELVYQDGFPRISFYSYDPNYEGFGCRLSYQISQLDPRTRNVVNLKKLDAYRVPKACGICAMYDMEKAGVTTAKIAGRTRPTMEKLKDIILVKRAVEILEMTQGNRKKYLESIRPFVLDSCENIHCETSCYYPSIVEHG